MRTRLVLFVAGLAAGVIVSVASATESTIYPGVGIGKVKLGMTKPQVEHVLGQHDSVNQRTTIRSSAYLELGWNFASWSVGLLKSGRTYHVVDVATVLRGQQTAKKVGPGTLWLKLVRSYPGGVCTFGYLGQQGLGDLKLEYLVPHQGGTQTIYVLQSIPPRQTPTDYVISEVHVRTPFQAYVEFSPDYKYKCQPGWQNARLPRPYGQGG